MKYNFPMTLDKQFQEALEELHSKYGTDMMEISGLAPHQLDTCEFFAKFLETNTVADSTIDDNANVSNKNINTMLNEANKPFHKLLSRNKIFIEMKEKFGLNTAKQFLEYDINGRIYEHDSHASSYKPYCYAFSLDKIVDNGLFFLDEMAAKRPKHWDTFNHHVLEFIAYATNQLAGAVGIPDLLVYAYYFYKKDTRDMDKEQTIKYRNQKFQEFVFSLNQPYLKSGIQSAYTNISILDLDHLAKFFHDKKYPDGTPILSEIDGIMNFQKDFLDYIGELRKEKWHTFPVISASLVFKDGKYTDEETAKMVVKHNWKYGFNDVNIMNVEQVTGVASCCRLVSDSDELSKSSNFNSIGGSDLNVGSTKVVTLNLARHAMMAKRKFNSIESQRDYFIDKVDESVDIIHKYHSAHRDILKKLEQKGMLPLYTHGLMHFDRQFATVGINGLYEAIKILGGVEDDNSYGKDGYELAQLMFDVITSSNDRTKSKYGFMSNIEQAPAESASVKLAKKDKIYYGKYFVNNLLGENHDIYGNQWIPLSVNTDIFNRIDSASHLDEYCGGGAIIHLNLGENFNNFEDAWNFTLGLAKKGIKYFSYISLIDICEEDHSFFGNKCPICGGESVSKGIKIVGYLVKQDSFSGERKDELEQRQFYDLG